MPGDHVKQLAEEFNQRIDGDDKYLILQPSGKEVRGDATDFEMSLWAKCLSLMSHNEHLTSECERLDADGDKWMNRAARAEVENERLRGELAQAIELLNAVEEHLDKLKCKGPECPVCEWRIKRKLFLLKSERELAEARKERT